MKKILYFALCLSAFAGAAQNSISVINMANSTIVAANDTIFETVTATNNVKTTLNIKNISTSTNVYSAKRYDMLLNVKGTTTADAYFCFGGNCYGSGTLVSPNPLTLTASQSASQVPGSYNMLVADIDEAEVAGRSYVKYTFFNTNPNKKSDSIQINIKYNFKTVAVGITSLVKTISNVEMVPNPAKVSTTIYVTAVKAGDLTLAIYNSLGALVSSNETSLDEGKNAIQLNTASFASGIYFVSLKQGDIMITKKLIVN